eukprot:TRINITY_DN13902_c0_g1_i1.p2 TRINITY_DN13902_c0_g1~~TRINITY_DN13902_c0_g1_i1.p2  ORF type:complete len:218 (+),score=86.27 TRINITY_DN13902_c0_g1_i1:136-789(+)
MICNACHAPVGDKDTVLVTVCMHMYCIACAEAHFAKTERCRCGKHLEPEDVSRVDRAAQDGAGTRLLLAGMGPEAVMKASEFGVAFWGRQAQLKMQYMAAKLKGAEQQQKEAGARLQKSEHDVKLRDDRIRTLEQRAKCAESAHASAAAVAQKDAERVALALQAELRDAQKTIAGLVAAKAAASHVHAAPPLTPPLTPFELQPQTPDGMGLPWGGGV